MKSSYLFLAVLISIFASTVSATPIPIEERFDSVTAPALPTEWSSQSFSGPGGATTSTVSPDSGANSAFMLAPSTASNTALNTKTYNFTTGLPTYELEVSFKHKRGMESSFDGGVFEISVNGATFVDIKHPSIGGTFISGDYNGTAGSIPGRPCWTGTSASYETVKIKIPAMPDNASFRFRFRVATDFIIAGPGWFIDTFSLRPQANLISQLTPLKTEIAPGEEFAVDFATLNPTSFTLNFGTRALSAPASLIKNVTLTSSGLHQRVGNWLSFLVPFTPSLPFTSDSLSARIVDIPGRSAAKMSFTNTSSSVLLGASIAINFVSSSVSLPGGALSGESVFASVDPCAPPVPVFPTLENGRIVVFPVPLACPFGPAALAMQQRGAIAFIAFAPSPTVPPAPGEFPSPFVSEASVPGLTIPMFAMDQIISPTLLSAIGAPGTSTVSIQGFNGSELRTIAFTNHNQIGDDPKFGDSIVTTLVNVVTDVDNDGTPDIRDACKNDSAKIAPGACGCAVADADLNSNKVFDCQINADFKAELKALTNLIKKYNLKSKSIKTQKALLSKLRKSINKLGVKGASTVSVSSAKVKISSLTRKVDKALARILSARSAKSLASAKKVANTEIARLRKGIL